MANIRQLTEDNNQVFYPQTHEKAVIDSNGVTINMKIASKQDTISDLQTIRSGAAAGATAYQKPSGGVPKSDLASSVQTSISKADTAIQPAEFNELKEEVRTIGNGAYEEAWDGSSAPVVADIPAGVSVTYNSTSYTGTLAASASTVDKIYLVSDGNGNYDRYTTVEANGAYSWKKVGSTAIPLSNYSTKSEVSQLRQQVIYDVSAHNSGATFASLSALLSDADLATLIPTGVRCGGMSIRFIQTSDNKYVQFRYMGTDITGTPNPFLNTNNWSFCGDDVLVENPEYINVKTDADGKVLWAIKNDGTIFFGAGVPQQVIDYIEGKIAELSLDEYENIVAFLDGLIGSDTTLQAILESLNITIANKVDKAEGKSLINEEYASTKDAIENPEYLQVTLDSDDKVLQGIKADGTSYIGDDLQVEGNATVRGNLDLTNGSLESADNPEYLKVITDARDRVIDGIKKDGSHYIYNVQSESIDALREGKVSKEGGKGLSTNDYTDAEKELVAVHEIEDSHEYIKAEVDSEGKLLAGRTPDGAAFENVGFSTPKLEVAGIDLTDNAEAIDCNTTIEDPEGRSEITTDSEGRILSYRKADGTKVEKKLEVEDVTFVGEAKKQLDRNIANTEKVRDWHLPKYGYIDFVEETFYLTANEGYSDKNGILPMQVREDTYYSYTPLYKYYVKSTLTDNGDGTFSINENSVALDFYVPSAILSINDVLYVKATLTEVVDPETGDVTYSVNENSVGVTKIVDSPCVGTWAINKNDQHYIKINVDFDGYLNGTHYAQVKYQGNTTLYERKRNFRITFYKKSDYKKKDKIKIGEMLRLSGFNMKSEIKDSSRVKELVIYRLIRDIYEHRDTYDRYPWYKDNTPWCGATGTINGFNVGLKIGGELYGIYYFALKKDEKNYMLDGDNPLSGAFVQAYPQYYPEGYSTFWTSFVAGCWEDEMNDDKPQEVDDALSSLYDFINGNSFDKEHIPERMSVIDWIDYFIIGQVFVLRDNYINNVILYSDSNMQKWYPYIYDLDNALANNSSDASIDALYNQYLEGAGSGADVSVWEKLKDIYWDEIVNRYAELRNTVLNTNRVLESINSISDIPNDDVYVENIKWNANVTSSIEEFKKGIQKRLEYLDDNYFI